MMKGIPTDHKYRRYRSRLEARWAYFFDLISWKYEYEPYDLKGWIPDFCIYGTKEILVEVKPNSRLEEYDTKKIIQAMAGTEKEGKEILLLGSTIFENGEAFSGPALGWLGEYYEESDDKYWFAYAMINHNEEWGIFHEYGSYADRITGAYDGDHHLVQPSYSEVLQLWNEAAIVFNGNHPHNQRLHEDRS
jgi:hypothetical protein